MINNISGTGVSKFLQMYLLTNQNIYLMEYLFQDSDFCKKYDSTSYTQYIQKCN